MGTANVGGLALAILLMGCVGPGLAAQERALARRLADATPGEAPVRRRADTTSAEAPAGRFADATPGEASADAEDPFRGHAELERAALIGEALRRNPGLEAARSAWRAALARYPQATALEDPMLDGTLGPASFGSDAVDPGYRLGLSQALPFPGKLGLRGAVALAEAEASAQVYADERLRLALAASRLFDDYYFAARAGEINASQLALVEEFSQSALARYEAGTASQQDALLAEAEIAELLHREVELATAQRGAAERINSLLHRLPAAPLPPPPAVLPAPTEAPIDAEGVTRRALAEHPELRAARARVAAREQAVALARREFLPDFTLSGAYDRFWQEKPLQPMVGLALNVPLALGRRQGALEEAHARLARARSEVQREEDRVRLAVARAIDRLREAHHLLGLARDRMLPIARDRLAASRAAFESGKGSFLELIDAERGLRDALLENETAIVALWRRHADLDAASADIDALAAGVRP